ncbi:Uncharacterised protein [uncultured Blautia sp.]|nr:Uncharacterised protein [uncultured Blautia sp.]
MEITLPSVRRPTILVVEPPMSMPVISSILTGSVGTVSSTGTLARKTGEAGMSSA